MNTKLYKIGAVIGSLAAGVSATAVTLPNLTLLFQPVLELLNFIPTIIDTLPSIVGSLFGVIVVIAIYLAVLTLIMAPVGLVVGLLGWAMGAFKGVNIGHMMKWK